MNGKLGWSRIEEEARARFAGEGRFPLRAYSEFMPAPYVGIKPYDPDRAHAPSTAQASSDRSLDVSEYEQVQELEPGLQRIADHLLVELGKLQRGEGHGMSRSLLRDNRAWPAVLADAAVRGRLQRHPLVLAMPLALSRTQDDKGNNRWTLFGASHDGAAAAFWNSFGYGDRARFGALLAWATGEPTVPADGVRVLADAAELPYFLRDRLLGDEPLGRVRTLVTFRPFASLPEAVQRAYLAGDLTLVPSPASLVFFEHTGYRKLEQELPRATQIPLLHLFPRIEGGYAIRIPQSGWLDERPQGKASGHKVVSHVVRTHRWERVPRDESLETTGAAWDKVSVALFSTDPDELELYGKPMARNAQIWRESYQLLLDGPRATRAELDRAAQVTEGGGRFGYRFFYPPMQAGGRELYWHRPLVARLDPATGRAVRFDDRPPLGYVSAELAGSARLTLAPRLLDRPGHREAARFSPHEPGRLRFTTCHNARKLLELREYLGQPLPPSFARRLLHTARGHSLDAWLAQVAEPLASALRGCVGGAIDPGAPRAFQTTGTRAFEESVWRTIAGLAEGTFRQKETADCVALNAGRSGGPAARAAGVEAAQHADLERLGDHLHARYRELIARLGMEGRAEVVDHVFRWETDFDFSWSANWTRNQTGHGHERNVVLVIPGKNRSEAVIMGDHYDTAYMEDVYEAERGGDGLRAAASGADDNHSATSALLHAAEVLLPLARAGTLERDVWLVHLTGEEFPADCLGARALAQALVERRLAFTSERNERRDVSSVRVAGAFVLDMIGHNSGRDRDVFQIAPGEGAAAARLALRAHLANERWNRSVAEWNRAPARLGTQRALRMADGHHAPPPFAHLALAGEIRTEWEPRSALYNTDGQIFSDVGIPVVLFMENYDISRTGYHDTHDTMKNIDLDYASALTAIAIETVVDCATTKSL